jgi:hypothetical protein
MKLIILPRTEFYEKRKPFDRYIPEEEATDAFWSALESGLDALRQHLSELLPKDRARSHFGRLFKKFRQHLFGLDPEVSAWELPEHYQRCRVLYCYLYADELYNPKLLPGIAAAVPRDGKPWCAELECYSDAKILPNGNPDCIGDIALIDGVFYTHADCTALIAYAPRLGIEVA